MKGIKKFTYLFLATIIVGCLLYIYYRPTMEAFEDNKMSGWAIAITIVILVIAIVYSIWWFFFRVWIVGQGIKLVGNVGNRLTAGANYQRAKAEEIRAKIAERKAAEAVKESTNNLSSGGGSKRR